MQSKYINIVLGHHRGNVVSGTFEVVKPYNQGVVTVKAPVGTFGNLNEHPRVKVDSDKFQYVEYTGEDFQPVFTSAVPTSSTAVMSYIDPEDEFRAKETPEQAMERIRQTFKMLDDVAEAVADGIIRGLVVSGPPGIGKSHGIEAVFEKRDIFNNVGGFDKDYVIVSGNATAIGLYKTLWDYREKRHTVIFDDCDGVLADELSLNILKAALGSGSRRMITWKAESRVLNNDDIPNSFEFKGSVIFLTNINFDRTRESKIKHHLEAIRSRCHYLDLEIDSQSDMLLRIQQVIKDGMLDTYKFDEATKATILSFVQDNVEFLNELSLRTVIKIADFVKAKPSNWLEFVEATCMKRSYRFRKKLDSITVSDKAEESLIQEQA